MIRKTIPALFLMFLACAPEPNNETTQDLTEEATRWDTGTGDVGRQSDDVSYGPCEGPDYSDQVCRVVQVNNHEDMSNWLWEDRYFYEEGLLVKLEEWELQPEETLYFTTSYHYGNGDLLLNETRTNGASDELLTTTYTYDDQKRMLTATQQTGDGDLLWTTVWEYGDGWVREETTYGANASDSLNDQAVTSYYDDEGWVAKSELDEGNDGTIDSTCIYEWSSDGTTLTGTCDPMWFDFMATSVATFEDDLAIAYETFHEDGSLLTSWTWTYDDCRRLVQEDSVVTADLTRTYHYNCEWE